MALIGASAPNKGVGFGRVGSESGFGWGSRD